MRLNHCPRPDANSFNKTDLIGGWERAGNTDIPDSTISLPARAIASATFLKREFDHSEPKAFYGLNNLAAKAKRHGLTSQEYLEQRSSWKFDERDHKFYPLT